MKYLFHFIFCLNFSQLHAVEPYIAFLAQAKKACTTPLQTNFLRIVTQGRENLFPLSKSNFNSFLSRHYLHRWDALQSNLHYGSPYKEIGKQSPIPAFYQNLTSIKDNEASPLIDFHHEIKRRIEGRGALCQGHPYLGFREYISRFQCSLAGFETKSFSPGHQVIIHGKTPFPLTGLSFYDQDAKYSRYKEKGEKVFQHWLTPLEQALLMSSRDEYVKQLAILRDWGNYSRFALGYIPKGSQIVASVGLVAPQWSPDDLFQGAGKSPSEFQEGGATQFYIHSISNMHWVDIDVLDGDKLNVAEGLHKLGLLTEEERKTLVDFRKHWSQLV